MHIDPKGPSLAIADAMVAARYGREGIKTLAALFDHIDSNSTRHLHPALVKRVKGTAGQQRRNARLTLDDGGSPVIALPMNDKRQGCTVWAETAFATWLHLIDLGADGAWFYAYKGQDQKRGQVRTKVPLGAGSGCPNATLARLIGDAKRGQQARPLDGNPLNLHRSNISVNGSPSVPKDRVGNAKTNTRQQVAHMATARATLNGRDYGSPATPATP